MSARPRYWRKIRRWRHIFYWIFYPSSICQLSMMANFKHRLGWRTPLLRLYRSAACLAHRSTVLHGETLVTSPSNSFACMKSKIFSISGYRPYAASTILALLKLWKLRLEHVWNAKCRQWLATVRGSQTGIEHGSTMKSCEIPRHHYEVTYTRLSIFDTPCKRKFTWEWCL